MPCDHSAQTLPLSTAYKPAASIATAAALHAHTAADRAVSGQAGAVPNDGSGIGSAAGSRGMHATQDHALCPC